VVGAADMVGVVDAVAVDMVGTVGAVDAANSWMQWMWQTWLMWQIQWTWQMCWTQQNSLGEPGDMGKDHRSTCSHIASKISVLSDTNRCDNSAKYYITSGSNNICIHVPDWLPVTLSDQSLGELHNLESSHIVSTHFLLGVIMQTIMGLVVSMAQLGGE